MSFALKFSTKFSFNYFAKKKFFLFEKKSRLTILISIKWFWLVDYLPTIFFDQILRKKIRLTEEWTSSSSSFINMSSKVDLQRELNEIGYQLAPFASKETLLNIRRLHSFVRKSFNWFCFIDDFFIRFWQIKIWM